ncbi:MAG: M56 family metallopeptidase, partial [Phycisphaeraceae bacterium]|nr:M56 family metallopeptidase [Phycisphaeraceae bacterium]
MQSYSELLSSEAANIIGWALIHSLWLLFLPAIALWIVLRLLPTRFCNARYLIGCTTLLIMVSAIGLAGLLAPDRDTAVDPVGFLDPGGEGLSAADAGDGAAPLLQAESTSPNNVVHDPSSSIIEPLAPSDPLLSKPNSSSPAAGASLFREGDAVSGEQGGAVEAGWYARLAKAAQPWVAWLVPGWLVGVFGVGIWHLGGFIAAQRLRSIGTRAVPDDLAAQFNKLARQMGVNRAARLLESAVVHSPVVIGWLKPVILVPTSVLTGMPAEQIEVILAHELAHIRRHDYIINLIQAAILTLLFYHPAVWWVSKQIRNERECCCDDMVVKLTDRKLDYARALTNVALMNTGKPVLAVAADGGSLSERIRRFAGLDDSAGVSSASWLAWLVLLLLAVALPISLMAGQDDEAVNEIADAADEVVGEFDPSEAILGKWYGQFVDNRFLPSGQWCVWEFRPDGTATYTLGEGEPIDEIDPTDNRSMVADYKIDDQGRLVLYLPGEGPKACPFEIRNDTIYVSVDHPNDFVFTREPNHKGFKKTRETIWGERAVDRVQTSVRLVMRWMNQLARQGTEPADFIELIGDRPQLAVSTLVTPDGLPDTYQSWDAETQSAWLNKHAGFGYLPIGGEGVAQKMQHGKLPAGHILVFERPIPERSKLLVVRVDVNGLIDARPQSIAANELDTLLKEQTGKGLDAWAFEDTKTQRTEAVPPAGDESEAQESAIQPFDFWIAPASFEPPNTNANNSAQRVPGQDRPVYRTGTPFVTLSDIAHAMIVEGANAGPVFDLRLRPVASQRLQAYAREHFGEPMLISISGELVSAPIVHAGLSEHIQLPDVNSGNRAAYESVVRALQRIAADRKRIAGTWMTLLNNEEGGPHFSLLTLSEDGRWTTAHVWGTPHEPTAIKIDDRRIGWDLTLSIPMFAPGADTHVSGPCYSLNLRLDEQSSLAGGAINFIDDDTFKSVDFNSVSIESLSRRVVAQNYPELLVALEKAVAEHEAKQATARESGAAEQFNRGDALAIHQLSSYADSGTLGVAYTPPGGERIEIAIDARSTKAGGDDNAYLRLYAGAMHPDHDAAELIDEDSQFERQVFAALGSWVNSHFTAQEVDKILNEPNTDGLSEKQRWALRIERTLDEVRRYRHSKKFAIFPATYYRQDDGGQVAIATPETRRPVYYTEHTQMLTFDDIANAQLVPAERGDPLLQITLKPEAARRIEAHTRCYQSDALLIMIDGKPVCAPVVCGVNKGRFEILSLADDAQERFEQLIDLVRGRGQQAFSVNPIKPDNGDPA